MNTSQVIRIGVALALIFAAGVFTGRYTAPRSPLAVASAGGRTVTTDEVMVRLTAELGLDPDQQSKMRGIVEETSEQVATLPPLSPQRREILRKSIPQIRAVLRPEQYSNLDRFVEMSERRAARMVRRREALMNGPNSRPLTNVPAIGLPAPNRPAP